MNGIFNTGGEGGGENVGGRVQSLGTREEVDFFRP